LLHKLKQTAPPEWQSTKKLQNETTLGIFPLLCSISLPTAVRQTINIRPRIREFPPLSPRVTILVRTTFLRRLWTANSLILSAHAYPPLSLMNLKESTWVSHFCTPGKCSVSDSATSGSRNSDIRVSIFPLHALFMLQQHN
jgi:hypothetical protein